MKYFCLLLVATCLFACHTDTSKIVVPPNYFSISFNGVSYNEVSDAQHPITAAITTGKDLYWNTPINLASISVNTKNLLIGFEGEKNGIQSPTGTYSVGIRNAFDSTICSYFIVDKGNNNTVYIIDSISTLNIYTSDAHTITGSFTLKVSHYPIDSMYYSATGNFTYNLFYGTH